jgi:hypothetical protein
MIFEDFYNNCKNNNLKEIEKEFVGKKSTIKSKDIDMVLFVLIELYETKSNTVKNPLEVIKFLLKHRKGRRSERFKSLLVESAGYEEIYQVLLDDGRFDPSDDNNQILLSYHKIGKEHGFNEKIMEVIQRLVKDERVISKIIECNQTELFEYVPTSVKDIFVF